METICKTSISQLLNPVNTAPSYGQYVSTGSTHPMDRAPSSPRVLTGAPELYMDQRPTFPTSDTRSSSINADMRAPGSSSTSEHDLLYPPSPPQSDLPRPPIIAASQSPPSPPIFYQPLTPPPARSPSPVSGQHASTLHAAQSTAVDSPRATSLERSVEPEAGELNQASGHHPRPYSSSPVNGQRASTRLAAQSTALDSPRTSSKSSPVSDYQPGQHASTNLAARPTALDSPRASSKRSVEPEAGELSRVLDHQSRSHSSSVNGQRAPTHLAAQHTALDSPRASYKRSVDPEARELNGTLDHRAPRPHSSSPVSDYQLGQRASTRIAAQSTAIDSPRATSLKRSVEPEGSELPKAKKSRTSNGRAEKKPRNANKAPAKGLGLEGPEPKAKKSRAATRRPSQHANKHSAMDVEIEAQDAGKRRRTIATGRGEKPSDDATMGVEIEAQEASKRRKTATGRANKALTEGVELDAELQNTICRAAQYWSLEFPRCLQCIRRKGGDTCRFKGLRSFMWDKEGQFRGVGFVQNQQLQAETMQFPESWNVPLELRHTERIKTVVARALLPTLKKEVKHISSKEVIRRPMESEVRATCDICMTSLFSASWMCEVCGREACEDCFERVRELAGEPGMHAHGVLSCAPRVQHTIDDFVPVSRFDPQELGEAIAKMSALWTGGEEEVLSGSESPMSSLTPSPEPRAGEEEDIPAHDIATFTAEELTEDAFRELWAKGEPLVVVGLEGRHRIEWTPEYFIEHHGAQKCEVVDCQTGASRMATVRAFFEQFGKYEGRETVLKLKDWPPSDDFKEKFPEPYEDFAQVVPMPSYCRRDGVYNIASHFPTNVVAPDLGPKMYNAFASFEDSGSQGTTKLHMDMADAINVMTYAAPKADGSAGGAAWDLFRAEDADRIRRFLRAKYDVRREEDPIHAQTYYLDTSLRRELWERTGVRSYRVYQKPGQAVFIPAGCAHQVCNLSDCIKVANDFVSPENVARCETLTREFRALVWKEDVLQLRTMMWFAWLSCERREKEMGAQDV